MTTPVSLVPRHAIAPTSTRLAEQAMGWMQATLVQSWYVPRPDWDTWSINARRYAQRTWASGELVGSGRLAAVCLRLHQHSPRSRLEWVPEFPARPATDGEAPDRDRSTLQLAVLGPAIRNPRPADLALVDYLIDRAQQVTGT
ncbi:hypothetical protein BJF83_19945 [Nocardiopsis sp. CNR-923]|uniref:hypothetical protein n=1 Tax=Nocardiopsis sp. CNR-923 TaxID=1904965 RepID=UPI00095BFFEA|nr:hypothetical protein [Nocardiopsis sp. CNR-923]OLT26882.1 hypothetical protein BJF83_19945 [Nocardiopsis sp. CNR-923]